MPAHGRLTRRLLHTFLLLLSALPGGLRSEQDPIQSPDDSFYGEGLSRFNEYQKIAGNPPAKLDARLVEAAKRHGEYLLRNKRNQPMALDWHYQVEGMPLFTGKDPGDQARSAGFQPSTGYWVLNTMTPPMAYDLFSRPRYLWHHLSTTVYHRSMILGMPYEAVGFYRLESKGESMLVFFGSQKLPAEDRVIVYPGKDQANVPVAMLPEIPAPFETGEAGFPITLQLITASAKRPGVLTARITDPDGKTLPLHLLTPATPGDAGKWAGLTKLAAFASRRPLSENTVYTVYAKLLDTEGKLLFEDTWKFTTGNGDMLSGM